MPRKSKRRTRRKRGGTCDLDGFSAPGMKSYINAEVNNISGKQTLPFGWQEKEMPETKCPDVRSGNRTGDLDLAGMREQIKNYQLPFTEGNRGSVKDHKRAWSCGTGLFGSAAKHFKNQKTKMYNELVEHLKTKKNDYPNCNWDSFEKNNPILKGGKRKKSRKKRRKSKKRKSRRKRKRSRRRRRRR